MKRREAEMSEFAADPGIIVQFFSAKLSLFRIWPMSLFHNSDVLYTKFCLVFSRTTLGRISVFLASLLLIVNRSNRDIGSRLNRQFVL